MEIEIVLTMFAVGLLLGFVGAGGSGVIIALLTVLFGIPIHVALGTALAAMVFSSFTGSFSHYREGNISLQTGLVVGLFGAIGAFISSHFTEFIPSDKLAWMTASMLILSGILLWLRMYMLSHNKVKLKKLEKGWKYYLSAVGIGLVTGALSGLFGIGAAPFIQIGLLFLLGLPLYQAAGTTMFVIVPIALAGGAGYYLLGFLDLGLLLQVVSGTMIGSYIGAKFTRRLPTPYLKTSMVLLPILGGVLLLLG